jgi:hypothetical protein
MTNTSYRKYLPTLSELIDRLSIAQLKEVFIPDHKSEYAEEINLIIHDIQAHIEENKTVIDAEVIRAIVVLSQMNLHIWHNETNYRKGFKDGNNLELTHGLNGIRNTAKNKIQEVVGGRKDYKIDCLAADFKDWEISW